MKKIIVTLLILSFNLTFSQDYFEGKNLYCKSENPEAMKLFNLGIETLYLNKSLAPKYLKITSNIFFKAYKTDTTFCDAIFFTGYALRLLNDEKVIACYIMADSLSKKALEFKINLASEGLRLGQDKSLNIARKKYNEIITLFPENPEGYYGFALTSPIFGDVDKGLENINIAIEKYKLSNPKLKDEVIFLKGVLLSQNKKYDEGIKYYRQYIKLKPDDIDSVIDFSRIIYSYEGSENGINEIKNNLQNNPNNLELLKCLASFYNFNKDYINAIEVQNQIIKSYYTVENINVRAILYSQLGKPDKVYEDLNRIIEIENCNAEYYSKILQYEYENKMYEKVIENSYKVIECNASYENSILDGLYTSLFFCGDFLKGNLYLDKKLASNPNNINPYYIKSLILLKNKQYDDVLKCLDLALKSKDIEKNDIVNINTVKFGFYLLKEDYQGFVNYFNSGDVKTLDNNLNFTFIEDSKSKVTEIKTDFNKTTGAVNSSIIIPTKVFKLLEHKYGLKIELEK